MVSMPQLRHLFPYSEIIDSSLARFAEGGPAAPTSDLGKHIHAMFKAHALAEHEVESITKLIANRSISDAEGAITSHF